MAKLLANADGRALAVKLLKSIHRLNDISRQDIHKSRDLFVVVLEQFRDLPKKERFRFATILNDTIASAYAGCVTDPAAYDRGRCEVHYMRMVTQELRENEAQASQRDTGAVGVQHG
jgi:uncharacterized protein (DUF2267 family)